MAANVTEDNERLARVSCPDLTYKDMKETLLRIFAEPAATLPVDEEKAPPVKTEPVFKVAHRGTNFGSFRGRGSYNRGNSFRRNYVPETRVNPTDSEGNVMRCYKCNSDKHFARFCDQASKNTERSGKEEKDKSGKKKPVYITLMANLIKNDEKLSFLLRESLGKAVLDTGCSKTVAGKVWVDEYINTLTEDEKRMIESESSDTSFVFGDGVEVTALKTVQLPVTIGSKLIKVEVDVVPNNIPLLFSRQSMKKGDVIINTKENRATVLGEEVELIETSSGHLCLPLTDKLLDGDTWDHIVLNATSITQCTREQKKQKAMKLHKQFSHPSKERLLQLVKRSKGFKDKEFLELIEECSETCSICKQFKRPSLRPVVTLPLANDFNQVVCMDLTELVHNKTWILHLIDSATKYSAGKIVNSKKKEEIMAGILNSRLESTLNSKLKVDFTTGYS